MGTQTLKGRNFIRKNGSVSGATGQTARLIKRWRFDAKPDTTLGRLEQVYMSGLDAVDRVEARAASNKTGGKFTRDGARDDVLHYALHSLIPDLHKARQTIKRAKAEIAERKAKLRIEGPDPSDIAAAFRRMEIRTRLREMKGDEQREYFAKYGDNLPSEVAAAVLELPPEYSGVMTPEYDRVAQRALAARYGAEIAETTELEDAISVAENVVEIARDEVRLEVGGIDKQNLMNSPRRLKLSTRHHGYAVAVARFMSSIWIKKIERLPSGDELAHGIFAATHDEYIKQEATVPV